MKLSYFPHLEQSVVHTIFFRGESKSRPIRIGNIGVTVQRQVQHFVVIERQLFETGFCSIRPKQDGARFRQIGTNRFHFYLALRQRDELALFRPSTARRTRLRGDGLARVHAATPT